MSYTISIEELIKRPLIRNDHSEEWLNKMSDTEIKVFEKEAELILLSKGVKKQFPKWNSEFLSLIIDRSIIYRLLNKTN